MHSQPITCAALVTQLRRQHTTSARMVLCFGHCKVSVTANRNEMIAALGEYFAPFVSREGPADIEIMAIESTDLHLPLDYTIKPPDPGKAKIKEEYVDLEDGRVVRKRLTGMVFLFGQGYHLAIGPCMENLNQVINFINNRYIEWLLCRGCLLGHAAGVTLNGRGLAFAGFSGAGKSTLALQVMNKGAVFVSNDRLLVEKRADGPVMHGVAKMPRINPGTALNNPHLQRIMSVDEQERFLELDEEALWEIEHKYDAPIADCYGPGRFVLSAPMNGLVLLNWRRAAGPLEVEQVSLNERRDLLPAFMKSVGLFFMPGGACRMPEPTENAYIDFLSACPTWEFRGGIDFESAALTCVALCAHAR
jgi:HprK-related kinase B